MDQDCKPETTKQARRLCSEIQLFDLCELEKCNHRVDRLCTNSELLSKFEQIAEDDMSRPTELYLPEELEESEDVDDELGCGDVFSGDDCDCDDEEGWEE